ncbi:MAG: hypothetical protein JWM64_1135, partial [Frankiales bacterium]|nr:hypothetical protein [Frankiales bacterium]
ATAHGLVQPVPRHAVRRVLTPPRLPGPPAAAPAPQQPAPLDDDEVFRQIVAGFDRTSEDEVPRWPTVEDTDGPSDVDAARRRPPPVDRAPRRRKDDAPLPAWLEPDALEPEPDEPVRPDDHFVPPPPPPVPRISVRTLAALAVLVLGLVLLFVPQLVGLTATSGVLLLGVVLLGGGAAMLVHRVRDAPPHDTGPDDGAVV